MTRIVIDDIESFQDLLEALAHIHGFFVSHPRRFDSPEERFYRSHDPLCVCDGCMPGTGPLVLDGPPKPLVVCPARGTHLALTDCWACWSDVHRGACLETDVLAPEAWDIAVAELVAPDPTRRGDAQ